MKIIEQGKKIDLSIRFISTCPNCHCGTSHTKNDGLDDDCSKMRIRDIYQS